MDDRTRRVLLASAVAVLAVAGAAATLDSAVQPAPGGGIPVQPPAPGDGRPAEGPSTPCVPWLATPAAGLALLGGLVLGTLVATRRYGRLEATAFAVGIGLPSLGLYATLTACATMDLRRRMLGRLRRLPPGPASDGSAAFDPGVPPSALGAVLVVGLLLAGLLLYLSLRAGDDGPAGHRDGDGPGDSGAAARTAGEAADRIAAGGDLESEIHRAWRDMAAHLDVARPASSTPGEFADAALEAGLPGGAVRELTVLFEQVRYGGVQATPGLEARALDALQRIEDSHPGGPTDG